MELAVFTAIVCTILVYFMVHERRGAAGIFSLYVDGRPTTQPVRIRRIRSPMRTITGLLNHVTLPPTNGLWLDGCRAVHTRGMAFSIDLVFMTRRGIVLHVERAVAPGKCRIRGPRGTRALLELAADVTSQIPALTVGAQLSLVAQDHQ